MSAISNISNLKAMVEAASAEERAEILSLLQPAKKVVNEKAAPPAPVLADGWAVADPAKKGDHKGKPRWYHAENEEYAYEFPAAVPAVKKTTKAAAKAPAAAAPVADDEARDKRLMGRMTKEEQQALSKEDKKRRNELKKIASEERKAARSPEEQAKIDARVAAMQAGRAKSKAAAGGSPTAEDAEESGSAEE